MSEQSQDITPELIEMAVAIAIGSAGLQMTDGVSEDNVTAIRALWPEELSGDALPIAEQTVLAITAWLNSQSHFSEAIEGGDLLAFSQSLLPSNE